MNSDIGKLLQKLEVDQQSLAYVLHAPDNYALRESLKSVDIEEVAELDIGWLQAFYTDKAALEHEIVLLKPRLKSTGKLWLCWPKKSSGITSDLSDTVVRQIGVENGLVDVKVAAIDDIWSGLKFVYKLTDRS